MKLEKANKRDKNSHKAKHGMKSSGKSVFLIQQVIIKRGKALEAKNVKG